MDKKVYGARCKDCGKETYPAHARCPECGSEALELIEITGEGKVLTYTDLYALPLDYEQRYLRLAIVELDSGLRATGQLMDEKPKIGKRVKTRIGIVRQSGDRKIHGLQFLPVQSH
jgi:uncharacterized OB-fold protein